MSVQARQARRLNRPDAGSPYSYGYCVFSGWVARGRRGSGCSLSMTLLGCRVGSILRMWEVDRSRDGTGHVFISYVREDQQRVSRLEGQFRSAGIRLWRDSTDLRPGQDWAIEIRRAIERGLAFIACFSEHTERRSASFQNKELIWAVEEVRGHQPGRVWLLPVRFAECKLPTFDLGGGRSLDALHRVDLFEDSIWDSGAKRLWSRCGASKASQRFKLHRHRSRVHHWWDLIWLISSQGRHATGIYRLMSRSPSPKWLTVPPFRYASGQRNGARCVGVMASRETLPNCSAPTAMELASRPRSGHRSAGNAEVAAGWAPLARIVSETVMRAAPSGSAYPRALRTASGFE
jgi:TIR domain